MYMRDASGHVFTTEHPEYHKDCERLTVKAGKAARQEYCRNELRAILKPGDTVYAVLRSVSSSGMSRVISLCVNDGATVRNIDVLACDAAGFSLGKNGIKVSGCGMDMGFHLVYVLGACLWPDGTPEPHGRRNGEPDSSGGYALKHEWI